MPVPSEADIEDQIALATAQTERGESKVPGMTYEEGVDAALRWAIGEAEEPPMDT